MAKIPYAVMPTKDDLGIVGINPTTKVIRQDVSHIGSGMKAIGAATKEVGQAMADYAEKKGIYEESEAETNFYIKRNELRERAEKEPYSEDMAERYSEEEVKASQEYAEKISHPAIRNRFVASSKQKSAESNAWFNDLSNKKKNESDLGNTNAKMNQLTDILLANGDVTKIGETLDTGYKMLDGLVGQGAITQEKAVVMKRQWASDIGVAMVGKVSPKVAAKILDEQESLAKEGKNYIPVTEIDRLRKDTSERNMDEFSVNYVDKIYKGSLGGGMRAIKNDKSLTAEQRIAAERRLSSIHSLAESDKADRQHSTYAKLYALREGGMSKEQVMRDLGREYDVLTPEQKNNLNGMGAKRPDVTDINTSVHLSSLIDGARHGNPRPLRDFLSRASSTLSKEDMENGVNALSGRFKPDTKEYIKDRDLANGSFVGKKDKLKRDLLYADIQRFRSDYAAQGKTPTHQEVLDFTRYRAKMINNSRLFNSGLVAGDLSPSAALRASRDGVSEGEVSDVMDSFNEMADKIGKETVMRNGVEANAVAIGNVIRWKDESKGVKKSDQELSKRYHVELALYEDENDILRNGFTSARKNQKYFESVTDIDEKDEGAITEAFDRAHRKARFAMFERGIDPAEMKENDYLKAVTPYLDAEPIIKKYNKK